MGAAEACGGCITAQGLPPPGSAPRAPFLQTSLWGPTCARRKAAAWGSRRGAHRREGARAKPA